MGLFDPSLLFDCAISDPPLIDPSSPPVHTPAHFTSHGSVVQAQAWIAGGTKPRGTAVLCAQMFGGDRLESLIIPLLSSGINVLSYHPRGMWDDRHQFTLQGAVEDAFACAQFVQSTADGTFKTVRGNPWYTDPERVVFMGVSGGGGNVSLAVCAGDPMVQSAVAIAPSTMRFDSQTPGHDGIDQVYAAQKELSAGRVDPELLFAGMTVEDFDKLSPMTLAPRLVEKNVLLVGAQFDDITPLESCHEPIAQAFRAAGVRGFTEVVFPTDHLFLTSRIGLAQVIIGWLRRECGF